MAPGVFGRWTDLLGDSGADSEQADAQRMRAGYGLHQPPYTLLRHDCAVVQSLGTTEHEDGCACLRGTAGRADAVTAMANDKTA